MVEVFFFFEDYLDTCKTVASVGALRVVRLQPISGWCANSGFNPSCASHPVHLSKASTYGRLTVVQYHGSFMPTNAMCPGRVPTYANFYRIILPGPFFVPTHVAPTPLGTKILALRTWAQALPPICNPITHALAPSPGAPHFFIGEATLTGLPPALLTDTNPLLEDCLAPSLHHQPPLVVDAPT